MTPSQRLVIVQFALFAVIGVSAFAFIPISPVQLRAIGLFLMLIGVIVLGSAIGIHQTQNYAPPNITPDPKRSAKLIKSGIYARVRHPIYAGVLLTVFGLTLAHGHPVMWALMAALYIFFYAKSRYEEALLLNYYGKSYAEYMKTTGRFLPRFSS